MTASSMEELVSLCKRRGFIYQASDVYGGLQGVYDFGPLGAELKKNLKEAWWRALVYERNDVEGIDGSILTHRRVLQYSGHEETFTDPLVDCRSCRRRARADHLQDGKCPNCGSTDLTEPRPFNLMFKTHIGPVESSDEFAYLRPETAQTIFTNFKNVLDSCPRKLPFGIAQIGRVFRNEITPRNFIFRVREFEIMEVEFFVEPGTDEEWHASWVQDRLAWWEAQGIAADRLECYSVPTSDRAHYSKNTIDLMYPFPHGTEELEGIANRTDFDLGSHTKQQSELNIQARVAPNQHATERLAIQDSDTREWVVPFVIEPSVGVERAALAVLNEAYRVERLADGKERVVLGLKPHLAPIKTAVIPLSRNRPELVAKAEALRNDLQKLGVGRMVLENTGNIGKNYRKHDEIGTPYCVTVDFDTLDDDTVTVRDRDSMSQERVAIPDVPECIRERL